MENSKSSESLPKYVQAQVKSLGLELRMDQITRTASIFNANQVAKIFSTTPAKYKYQRPGKGGGKWDYVRSSYVRRVLDALFGFNWDFDIDTSVGEAFEIAKATGVCVVKGTLTGRTFVGNEWVSIKKTQFGRAEVKFKKDTKDPLDFGNDLKGAGTDALKKCSQQLGIAADVYDPSEFQEIKVIESEEQSAQHQNLNAKIEAARSTIEQDSAKVD